MINQGFQSYVLLYCNIIAGISSKSDTKEIIANKKWGDMSLPNVFLFSPLFIKYAH